MLTRQGSLRSFPLPISVCLFVSLSAAQIQLTPEQRDFKAKVGAAYAQRDDATITSLVGNNRFVVKPVVDELLNNSITAELQKNDAEAQQARAVAAKLAETHRLLFSERSLVLATQYVAGWTKDQKLKKLSADSIYAAGTSLRGKAETREQASKLYEQALVVYKSIGDNRGVATTLGGMGVIAWSTDGNKALEYMQKALSARTEVDDHQLMGNSLFDVGGAYSFFFKDYPNALVYYHRAESLRSAIGDKRALARTLQAIVQAYRDMGQPTPALIYAQKNAQLNRELGDKAGSATSLSTSATLYSNVGRYHEALEVLGQAKTVADELADKKLLANVLNQRGIIYNKLGEATLALDDYNAQLILRKDLKDEAGEASALNNIGVLLHDLNKTDQAIQYFEKALGLAEKIKDRQLVLEAESNLGMMQMDLKNYDKAEQCCSKALALSRELKDKSVEINNLINLANAQNYGMKDSLALANYHLAFQEAEAMNNPAVTWQPLLGFGDFYERRSDPTKALTYYERALEILEGIRLSLTSSELKASYWAQQRLYYEAIIHFLSTLHDRDKSKGYDSKAFSLAERAKARAFLDLLAGATAGVQTGRDSLLIAKQKELFSDLAGAQRQLAMENIRPRLDAKVLAELNAAVSARQIEYQRVRDEISARFPRYAELNDPQPISIVEIQSNLLDGKTLLLEYSIGDSSTTLWAITKTSRSLFLLPPRDTLNQYIEVLRFALTNQQAKDPTFFATASHKLYRLLLAPVESHLKKNSRIIIVPDGMLHYVPFASLVARKPTGAEQRGYSNLPYLAKTHQITYAASASVLQTINTRRNAQQGSNPKEFLAFGDPAFSAPSKAIQPDVATTPAIFGQISLTDLPRLPYSGEEVRNIAALFPSASADVFVGQQATEERVKESGVLGRYKFVHFATHGIINERQPDQSGIVLARTESSSNDGFLQTSEIFGLTLNANLVVLSACQTGLGKLVQGEGIVGLTRPFLYAGSRSVMVSLWSVADQSTSKLMQQFYKNLVSRKLEKPQALQEAQLSLMKDSRFSHPFSWAPFVLIGDRR